MGQVYRARDTRLNRSVAIKVLPASFASRPLRRFEQEARTVAALNHPNILGLHEIGSQNGTSSLVSEFLEGNTLREQLAAEFALTTPELVHRERSIDGTEKFLLRLADGQQIESVFIPDTPSMTFCNPTP